ncbi:MAG: TatD family hydrolase [Candidatus Paceibacterota bacterium]
MYKYVDNHAHLNLSAYNEDREETIKRAKDSGVLVINVGTQKDTSKKAVEIAEKTDNCFAIVGLHPVHTSRSFHDEQELGEGGKEFTSRGEIFDYEYYKKLCESPKVVGIGECGLDYYRGQSQESGDMNEKIEKQKDAFRKQIELAIEVKKPLMLHIREAYKDALEILTQNSKLKTLTYPGNVHFFAGTLEEVKEFLNLGFTISFTGVITFAKQYEELVKFVPLEKMLSETDCPYVAPSPYRGKRNESLYVIEVIKKIAEIKQLPFDQVALQLRENSKKLWGI